MSDLESQLPRHEAGDIDHFLEALDDVWKTLDLKRSDLTTEEKDFSI